VTALGNPRLHRRQTGSTNADARAVALAGAPHGTLVSAGEQLEGRGRQGREWHAPAGSALLCSLVLTDPPPLLALIAGVAVAAVVGDQSRLKWPNDVLLGDGRKVAGILVEARAAERWAVLGIGINVAVDVAALPAQLHSRAGSLGLAVDAIEPMLTRLLAELTRLLALGDAEVLAAWRERDVLLGRAVRYGEHSGGTACGIDDAGRLLIAPADGAATVAVSAGEVHLVS
jgi:BirA family biotin operon repressor/biotin-[acetyl-CoA-carboxylase] ligase